MAENAITIRNLNGGYADNPIIKNLSLEILKGGFTAIAGPNGAGKSTLLKYLIRELRCSDGSVTLFDTDINLMRQREIARLISFQGQYIPKNEEFTVREVVALGRYAYGDVSASDEEVESALKLTGMEQLADKLITRISGGEFQLAMLARTICQNARILALDEPVNNLDPKHQMMLLKLLSTLAGSGKTVICVLHDLNAILRSCSRCILMKEGRVFAHGDTREVLCRNNIREVYGIDVEILERDGKSVILFS
ncbi:MAG: ABC transporter ATP-binding protein [Spirochaetales bacterium]|nr:ABC transporter ATP-binding protein [Spirochaetales bacterium]